MYVKELENIRSQLAVGVMALSHIVDSLDRLDKVPYSLKRAEMEFLEGCRSLGDAVEELKIDSEKGQ